MSIEKDTKKITKENIDIYLKEFAKVFKKMNGDKMSTEIIMVGGASVLTNYNFRKSTGDIDAVILSSSVIKDVINVISEKYNLPNDWLNTDFKKSNSYSPKLREVSVPYKTFSSIVSIRTIKSEYLIAMKLMAGREYKHDMSDIVGIFLEHKKKKEPISLEKLDNAIKKLYGNMDKMPEESLNMLNRLKNTTNYEKLFKEIKNKEKEARKVLNTFSDKYPNVLTKDNINNILKQLLNKKKDINQIIPDKKMVKYSY